MLDSIKSVNLTQLNFWSQLGSFNFQTQCYFCSQWFEQDSRASIPHMPKVLLELFTKFWGGHVQQLQGIKGASRNSKELQGTQILSWQSYLGNFWKINGFQRQPAEASFKSIISKDTQRFQINFKRFKKEHKRLTWVRLELEAPALLGCLWSINWSLSNFF